MIDSLLTGDFASAPTNIPAMVLGLLVAFAAGHAVAWVYMWTHSGLSYSRSFVNSLVVIPTVVSLVMMVLSNNLITAFGLMAVFAIVRFRNILRDTLDTTYILVVIVIGNGGGDVEVFDGDHRVRVDAEYFRLLVGDGIWIAPKI
jgi:hypothetical protein